MAAERLPIEQRVLVIAPTLRDGEATKGLLTSAGIPNFLCHSIGQLCDETAVGCCAIILPEELIVEQMSDELGRLMADQPVWSDLPVIMLSRSGGESAVIERATHMLRNVSVVERPMRVSTFLSMVRVALQARERQYQVRDHLLEQKANEQRLAESEQRARAAFDQSVVGIVFSDLDGKIQRANDAFCTMVGYSCERLIGLTSVFYTHPEDVEVADAVVRKLKYGTSSGAVYEKRFICSDGRIIFAHISLSVIKNTDAAAESLVAVVEDVTHRKEIELVTARDAALLTNVRDSVIVTDLHGRITYWNDGATALFGWTAAELMGRPMSERLPIDQRPAVDELIKKIAAGETEYEGEWLDYRKDGSQVWIEATTRLAKGRDGTPIGIIGVSRDITARKQSEIELQTAKEVAESANRAKDEFLAVLSHELRTPLTPVLLIASLMENNRNLPEEFKADVATIRQNVELESRLISDLLDVTRIIKGKLQLDMQDVDLHQLIRSAIAICQREVSANLAVELSASSFTVKGDSIRLQQIFWNLINNAMKFTPGDGKITVRSENIAGGRIRVEVSDTGAGIDPELLPRLFDAFEQGEVTTERQRAGLGLGLSISLRLSQMHGGSIRAQSAGRGKGSKFIVELPTVQQTEAAAEPERSPKSTREKQILKVLLIEDHDATQRVLARLLRMSGHHVTAVGSVASAQAAVQLEGFDIIVSDLGLPDGSGLDIMRPLRDQYAGRAIALTGFGMDSDVQACRDAGFAEHITKPVDVTILESAIDRISEASVSRRR